ncbi:MAG: CopD family protein [Burkholderiales bacterium]|nr:CopD family protein [Burkholderiales bacterium]
MDQRIAVLVHVLGVVVWVGGMFFAYVALRPAAVQTLEPAQRLPLWAATFERFFPWVWLSVIALFVSGLYLIAVYGGFGAVGLYIHTMLILGLIMMLIFFRVYFAPYRRLKNGVAAQEWKSAAAALAQIRVLIGINLSIGIAVIFIAILGKLWI